MRETPCPTETGQGADVVTATPDCAATLECAPAQTSTPGGAAREAGSGSDVQSISTEDAPCHLVVSRSTASPCSPLEQGWRSGAARIGVLFEEYARQIRAGNRWCFRCRCWLRYTQFYAHPRMPSGRDTQCRPCARAYAREYQRRLRGYQGKPHALKGMAS